MSIPQVIGNIKASARLQGRTISNNDAHRIAMLNGLIPLLDKSSTEPGNRLGQAVVGKRCPTVNQG